MLTLQEKAEIEFEVQEAMWRAYENASPDLIALGWIHKPDERLTIEQIAVRLSMRISDQYNFSMRHVVTGARRKWKGIA